LNRSLSFRVLGQHVRVDCRSDAVARTVLANFKALAAESPLGAPADVHYVARGDGVSMPFALAGGGAAATRALPDLGELLFHLEKDLVITLQRRRPELLFLHAAALARGGRAWLLAGDSGSGKSTTAWGLLHHGLGYLSDELSPVDLRSLEVLAYPHALCMKRPPPPPYALPPGVLDLGATLHVPVDALPGPVAREPCALAGIVFVRHRPGLARPVLRPLGAAEVVARLYVVTLNALAHGGHGLDAVQRLAERVRGYAFECGDLAAGCALLGGLISAPEAAVGERAAVRA
jgi:hypothetical protein